MNSVAESGSALHGRATGTGIKLEWWAGKSEEYFGLGPVATREDAIAEGRADDPGAGFFIIEAAVHKVRFSADRLIEDQFFENDDLFDCDHVEPDRLGDHATADAELQVLLDGWVEKHRATFTQPNMFRASRNLEWIEPLPED